MLRDSPAPPNGCGSNLVSLLMPWGAMASRLAQRFERRSLELGQLVEEEHAAVRERCVMTPERYESLGSSCYAARIVRAADTDHSCQVPRAS